MIARVRRWFWRKFLHAVCEELRKEKQVYLGADAPTSDVLDIL